MARPTPSPTGTGLLGDRLLLGLAAGVVLVVVYGWFLRLGSDLTWDEAMNQRVYARNPITAVALYHEPNNHVLDSLMKSLFYWGFGFEDRAWRRFPAYLVAVALLALVARGFGRRWQSGRILGAVVFAIGLLVSRALNYHAVDLRGYFLGMALILAFIEAENFDVDFKTGGSRRVLLAALLVFCVPTNVVLGAALLAWCAMCAGGTLTTMARRLVATGMATTLLVLLLYLPIILSLLYGFSVLHGKAEPGTGRLDLAMEQLAGLSRPVGVAPATWNGLMVAIGFGALLHSRRVLVRRGALLFLLASAAALALQLTMRPPPRVQAVAGVPTFIGLAMIVEGIASSWPRRFQTAAALALMGLVFVFVIPDIVEVARVETLPRPVSDLEAVLCAELDGFEPRSILALHEANSRLRLELENMYGPLQVAGTSAELRHRIGVAGDGALSLRETWKGRLRRIFGSPPMTGLDLSAVTRVVRIRDRVHQGNYWFDTGEGLDTLLADYPRVRQIHLPEFEVEIRER